MPTVTGHYNVQMLQRRHKLNGVDGDLDGLRRELEPWYVYADLAHEAALKLDWQVGGKLSSQDLQVEL